MQCSRHGTILAFLAAVIALAACASGGGKWRPNEPIRISTSGLGAEELFYEVVKQSRALGYEPEILDPNFGFFKVRARLYSAVARAKSVSFFTVQLESDGALTVRATGYHVRGDVMHRELRWEFDRYAHDLMEAIGK
jgi:hypothetical protein